MRTDNIQETIHHDGDRIFKSYVIDGDENFSVTDMVVKDLHPDVANDSEENRIKWITSIASISRGKDSSNNPEVRYKALLKEAAGGTASRAFEFLPVVIYGEYIGPAIKIYLKEDEVHVMSRPDFSNKLGRFGYMLDTKVSNTHFVLFTNMRALLNAGIPYEHIPYNGTKPWKDFSEEDAPSYKDGKFIVLKASVPMFVWAQFPMTHTQLSKISVSDRVTKASEFKFWLPADFMDRVSEYDETKIDKKYWDEPENPYLGQPVTDLRMWSEAIKDLQIKNPSMTLKEAKESALEEIKECWVFEDSQARIQKTLEILGYPQEIWSRALYYFKYKQVIIGGWAIDPSTWRHALTERNAFLGTWKNWTQTETAIFAGCCADIIFPEERESEEAETQE